MTNPPTPAYESPDPERPSSAAPPTPESQPPILDYQTPEPKHDPYLALRFRDYRIYNTGWIVGVVGQTITATAVGWQVYDLTHSEISLGYVAGIQAIPLVFLALPAGVIADIFDRRRILLLTSILAALAAIALFLLPNTRSSIPWIYAALLLWSSALTVSRTTRATLLPTTVPRHAFSNAVTWNSSFFQLSAITGPAIAGLIVAFSSAHWAYLADACCALFFAAMILRLPHRPAEPRKDESILQNLIAGIHFVWRTRIILATLTLDLFAVLLGGAVYLLPIFARDILHVGPKGFGLLRAADAIGSLAMALLIAHLPPFKKAGHAILLAVAAFGLATIAFGLSKNFYLSLGFLFLVGAFDNISVVIRHTLVQLLTPDAMRGRVSAVNNIFIGASNELGGLESGLTAKWLGPINSVVYGGLGTLLTVALIGLGFKELREYGKLDQKH